MKQITTIVSTIVLTAFAGVSFAEHTPEHKAEVKPVTVESKSVKVESKAELKAGVKKVEKKEVKSETTTDVIDGNLNNTVAPVQEVVKPAK